MQRYEFKVIPAPKRGEKVRGARTPEDRFAQAMTSLLNREAAEGWEFQRTETLPVETRTGLTGRVSTNFQYMVVFRRPIDAAMQEPLSPATARAPIEDSAPRPAAAPAAPVSPPPAAASKIPGLRAKASSAGPRLVANLFDRGRAPSLGPAEDKTPRSPDRKID